MNVEHQGRIVVRLIPTAVLPHPVFALVVDSGAVDSSALLSFTPRAACLRMRIVVAIAQENGTGTIARLLDVVLRLERLATKCLGQHKFDDGVTLDASQADQRFVSPGPQNPE